VKYPYSSAYSDQYITAVNKEIGLKSPKNYQIDSVYFGGGTPSLLEKNQIFSILNSLHKHYSIKETAEITIECNPEDLSKEKFRSLKSLGFNRLSIGVQSFVKEDLKYLCRNHNELQSERAIGEALESGFTNLNIDFIIGIPNQNTVSLDKNFSYLRKYKIPHISCYLLEIDEGYNSTSKNEQKLYHYTRNVLKSHGYIHYEVSNFCRPGFESLHNLKYWKNKDYIGIGLSASGYENDIDYKNVNAMNEYLMMISRNILPVKESQKFDQELRKIVVGLRLINGIPISNFTNFKKELELLISNDLLRKNNLNVYVNPQQILLLNEILINFL
jgi:oxygen-independent coproporphyrinogen-3 oxidase